MPKYLPRSLESVARSALSQFPAVVISGPRQSGKTTLAGRLLSGGDSYASLDLPDVRAAATEDPRGFLNALSEPVILDEVQRAPDLLSYLRERIDADRDTPGRFILTGSQNLLLLEKVTESLAGRAAMLTLMPLSQRELDGQPQSEFAWEAGGHHGRITTVRAWFERLIRSSFPEPALGGTDPALWLPSYVASYLERDVRLLRNVGDLQTFDAFLRLIAARTATTLDMADIGRSLGVALNTVKAWVSVLVASHILLLLPPYHANIGKRLVKRPKVYLLDVGLACHLTGLRDPEAALAGPLGGALFETAVVSEVHRSLLHRGLSPEMYFWGVSGRTEVDLLVRHKGRLVPIEVKLTETPVPRMGDQLRSLIATLPTDMLAPGYVVTPGSSTLPLGKNAQALPFAHL